MQKILIVEDDDDIAGLISNSFPENEFDIQIAHDCAAAKQKLERFRPHLVIIDEVLPDENGRTIIGRMRELHLKAIVFLMTGFDTLTGKDAYDAGAHIFFRKPFNCDEILAAARRFLRDARFTSAYNALSKRETEILDLLAKGYTSKDIAKLAGISVSTVNKHRENMIKRVGAKNTAELLAMTQGIHPGE